MHRLHRLRQRSRRKLQHPEPHRRSPLPAPTNPTRPAPAALSFLRLAYQNRTSINLLKQ